VTDGKEVKTDEFIWAGNWINWRFFFREEVG
jgi:hypothetical protein